MNVAAPTADLAALARTRARRAVLLGRLLVTEPGPEEVALAHAIPSLRADPRVRASVSEPAGGDPRVRASVSEPAGGDLAATLRADYARVLLREVPAHECVFRNPDGQLGRVDPDLLALYRRWGFEWDGRWRVAAPDQLGVQLHCYAHLCASEEQGWANDQPDRAAEAVEAQRELLGRHLGDWGPVAAEALRRAGAETAYVVVADALVEFLAIECDRLRPAADHPGMPAVAETLRLDARRGGGPGRISRRLLAPDRAGGFMTIADITPLAAALQTPWRASDTRSRLRHVIAAAMDRRQLDLIAEHLAPVVTGWAHMWEAERDRQPGAARIFEAWRLRAEATRAWLHGLDEAPTQPPVLRVPDAGRLAAAIAALSAAGFVVTVDPAPPEVLEDVDAVVQLDRDRPEGWDGDPQRSPQWTL
jgi:TorA maturation chaperone TorD